MRETLVFSFFFFFFGQEYGPPISNSDLPPTASIVISSGTRGTGSNTNASLVRPRRSRLFTPREKSN